MNVWNQACDVLAISRGSLCFSRPKIATTGEDSLGKIMEQASCLLVEPVVFMPLSSTSVFKCILEKTSAWINLT